MSDLNISLYQRGLKQDDELKMPLLNLRKSFYGKLWYLLPEVMDSGVEQNRRVEQSVSGHKNMQSKFRERLLSLRKRFWGHVNDVPRGTAQGL